MKLPKSAKRVFKGIIFDVYHWRQKMFDGSYDTFEALKRPDTVEVIAVVGDKIMIARQKQPTYSYIHSFFGGRQEPGETPLATAKRELLEEAGLKSNDWELFKVYGFINKIVYQVYIYIARDCKKAGDPVLDPGEKMSYKLVSFDELIKIVGGDNFWFSDFALDVFKMKEAGKLGEFKKKLFKQ